MIEVSIATLPPAPLHVFEIWSSPGTVAQRFETATGFALPPMGHSAGSDALRLIRYEPTVWLVEGDAIALTELLGGDGALTAIGGGVTRLRLSGPGWRRLLMEGGVFDAENPSFAPGCAAATIIDRVAVRLHVVHQNLCDAYVPASYSAGMVHFWEAAARGL